MYKSVLVEIAKRLPLPALRKFAQTNDLCNAAAREAWETWRLGCASVDAGRMFSDNCWMDAYARTCRQHAFRFVDGSKAWTTLSIMPHWLWVQLQPFLHPATLPAHLSLRVKADGTVLNMACSRNGVAWATLSSTGQYWRFTDAFPDMDYRVDICKVLNDLRTMLTKEQHKPKHKLNHRIKKKLRRTPSHSTGFVALATTVVL